MSRTRSLSKLIGPSGSQAFDTNTLVIDAANNRVGIGTTSPTGKLEIQGAAIGNAGVDVDYFKALKLSLPDATEWGGQAQFSVGRWEENAANARSSLVISLGHGALNSDTDADVDVMTLLSNGNVGIGTASPTAKLVVEKGSHGNYLYVGGSSEQNRGIMFSSDVGSSGPAFLGAKHTIHVQSGGGEILFKNDTYDWLYLAPDGNVGIGNTSPSSFGKVRIDVAGTTTPTNATNVGPSSINLYAPTNGGLTDCTVGIFGWQAAQPGIGSGIGFSRENVGDWGSQIRFYTHPTTTSNISDITERMRINSSGSLLVGTTSNPAKLTVSGASGTNNWVQNNINAGTGAIVSLGFSNANGLIGYVQTSGSTTSYITSSDYRLKTDAQPMTGASARVQALKPVNFEWISSGERVDGFLAHEAQEIVPEAVTGTKDAMRDEEYEVTAAVLDADGMVVTEAVMGTRSVPDYQGIDQSKLVPLLTAALQEAITKIQVLEARLTAAGIE